MFEIILKLRCFVGFPRLFWYFVADFIVLLTKYHSCCCRNRIFDSHMARSVITFMSDVKYNE